MKPIKRILFNISIRGVFVAISKLIGFVTIPIIAKALGPITFGKFSFIMALTVYPTLPGNWGFLAQGIREIAGSKDQCEKSRIVSSIFSARLLLSSSISIIFIAFVCFFKEWNFVLLVSLSLLQNCIITTFIDYYYYGTKNVTIPSVAHFLGQFIFAFLVVAFIRIPDDISNLFFFLVIMAAIESLILIFFARKDINIKVNFSIKKALIEFRKNVKLGVGSKVGMVQSSFPVLIIPFFLSAEKLGNYTAVYKLYFISALIMQMVVLAVAPYIIKTKSIDTKKRKYYIRIFILFSLLLGFGIGVFCFFISNLLCSIFFGAAYSLSPYYLKWFSASVLSTTPLSIALSSLMNNYSLDHEYMIGGFIQAAVIVVFSPLVLALFDIIALIILIGIAISSSNIYFIYSINKKYAFL